MKCQAKQTQLLWIGFLRNVSLCVTRMLAYQNIQPLKTIIRRNQFNSRSKSSVNTRLSFSHPPTTTHPLNPVLAKWSPRHWFNQRQLKDNQYTTWLTDNRTVIRGGVVTVDGDELQYFRFYDYNLNIDFCVSLLSQVFCLFIFGFFSRAYFKFMGVYLMYIYIVWSEGVIMRWILS